MEEKGEEIKILTEDFNAKTGNKEEQNRRNPEEEKVDD